MELASEPLPEVRLKKSYYFSLFEGSEEQKAVALNTRTGGTYAFAKEVLPALKRLLANPEETFDPELKSFLVAERILIPEAEDELEAIKAYHRQGRHSTEELYVTYSMTNACNFRCTYCYQEHKHDALGGENLEKTFKYVEREIQKYRALKVHWFGGEPLLRLKWLVSASERLRAICRQYGKSYFAGITTNGSLFTADAAKLLKEQDVRQVQFTLDGAPAIHDKFRIAKNGEGTFQTVTKAIQLAVDMDFHIFVRINVSPMNASTLKTLLDDFRKRGWTGDKLLIYVNEMKQHSNSISDNSLYFPSVAHYADTMVECIKLLRDYGYSTPRLTPVDVNCAFDKPSSVLFGTDGDLYHCTTGTDRALARLGSDGHILEETARRRFIHSREPWDDPHCATCTNLPTCMGGCAYLDEEGKTKCNPEGFVLEKFLRASLNSLN